MRKQSVITRRGVFSCGFEVKSVTDEGTFSGMGSVYGVVDECNDVIDVGAFADSLKEWSAKGRMPSLLWQHDSRSPIGAYDIVREEKSGLYVEGKLALKTQKGMEAHELMKMGAVSGLSVGFMTREDSYDQKTDIRTIKRADLYEVSVVTFPCNDDARVASVKSIDEIEDLSGLEACLREVGASRSEAKALASRALSLARREVVDNSGEIKAVMAALQRREQVLTSA